MLRFAGTLFFLWAAAAAATPLEDCQRGSATGHVVQPLSPVQDQDGMGTCYANVASLMLQRHLNVSAPVSYQHLGLAQSMVENRRNATLLNRVTAGGPMSMVSEGGFVCRAIDGARAHGFCRASAFGLDVAGGDGDPVGVQSYIMLELARLFDETEGNREALERLQTQQDGAYWNGVRSRLAHDLANRQNDCRGPGTFNERKQRYVARRFLNRLALQLTCPQVESQLGGGGQARQQLRQALFPGGDPSREPTLAVLDRIGAFLDPHMREAERFRRDRYNDGFNDGVTVSSVPSEALLYQRVAGLYGLDVPLPDNLDLGGLLGNQHISGDLSAWNTCSRTHAGLNRELLYDALNDSCHVSWGQAPVLAEHMAFAQTMVNALHDMPRDIRGRTAAYMALLSPTCVAEARSNMTRTADVQCQSVPVSQVAAASWRMRTALCEGKLVGVGICTDFMAGGSRDTQFCQNRGVGVEGHGMHAVTVIGHRTASSGRQFLVQNSWGRRCPSVTGIQCEMEGSIPTGRWWVDEALLLNNSVETAILR